MWHAVDFDFCSEGCGAYNRCSSISSSRRNPDLQILLLAKDPVVNNVFGTVNTQTARYSRVYRSTLKNLYAGDRAVGSISCGEH